MRKRDRINYIGFEGVKGFIKSNNCFKSKNTAFVCLSESPKTDSSILASD